MRSDDSGRRERTRPGFLVCVFERLVPRLLGQHKRLAVVPWLPRLPSLLTRTLLHWCPNPGRGSQHATMQPAQPMPLAELVKSLAGLHQAQHQALMDMKLEQEDRFRLMVQAQDEDPLVPLVGAPSRTPPLSSRKGPQKPPGRRVDPSSSAGRGRSVGLRRGYPPGQASSGWPAGLHPAPGPWARSDPPAPASCPSAPDVELDEDQQAPPWDSRPVSGAGVDHYQLLPAPLATIVLTEQYMELTYISLFEWLIAKSHGIYKPFKEWNPKTECNSL